MKILIFTLFFIAHQSANALIFGADDRHDVVESARANKLSRSIAMMQGEVFVVRQTPRDPAPDTYNLDFVLATDPYNLGLCKSERFSDQPIGYVNCTGFLIAEDILVTAGHCTTFQTEVLDNVSPPFCTQFKWIFDFKKNANGKVDLANIPADNIYSCKRIVHTEALAISKGNQGVDFAIIQLDRQVVGRAPLKLAEIEPAVGEALMVIGHPLAFPMKYADNAKVLPQKFPDFILTDLDIVGGNSGSPVFNNRDEVVGIAVRSFPYEDYNYNQTRKCSIMTVCPKIGKGDCVPSNPDEVLGTHVDKISHVTSWLNTPKLF